MCAITQHDSKIYFSRQLTSTPLHVLYAEVVEDRKRNKLKCCQADSFLVLIASRASNKATVTTNIQADKTNLMEESFLMITLHITATSFLFFDLLPYSRKLLANRYPNVEDDVVKQFLLSWLDFLSTSFQAFFCKIAKINCWLRHVRPSFYVLDRTEQLVPLEGLQ